MMFLSYTFTKGAMMCDAENRNKQALFLIETEWGCGRIDIGRICHVLRGDDGVYTQDCEERIDARTG